MEQQEGLMVMLRRGCSSRVDSSAPVVVDQFSRPATIWGGRCFGSHRDQGDARSVHRVR
jgi:hypothetical protein